MLDRWRWDRNRSRYGFVTRIWLGIGRALRYCRGNYVTGMAKGETVIIPRISIIPTDLPFQFKRVQFPLKTAFAMTINKAQGQTLKVAGVHLEKDCFSHGQLYVACSRVSKPQDLYIFAKDGKTKNVVYRNVLV